MRASIWAGVVLFGLGLLFSYLARALIKTIVFTPAQKFAAVFAIVLFVLFSALLLGLGLAFLVHGIISFGKHLFAFVLELFLSFAGFFAGIGATIMADNWLSAIHTFFTTLIASCALAALSLAHILGLVAQGTSTVAHYVKKRKTKRKKK